MRAALIPAIRHEERHNGVHLTRIVLDKPPIAVVPELDSVMGGWWYRAGGYPPGEVFATWLGVQP